MEGFDGMIMDETRWIILEELKMKKCTVRWHLRRKEVSAG
jgi:hypothetical protein